MVTKLFFARRITTLIFGATFTDFTAILQSIDYSKFERFSNVADEISAKLLSSILECELLVAVTDGYDV